jgi:hypothetical protein
VIPEQLEQQDQLVRRVLKVTLETQARLVLLGHKDLKVTKVQQDRQVQREQQEQQEQLVQQVKQVM